MKLQANPPNVAAFFYLKPSTWEVYEIFPLYGKRDAIGLKFQKRHYRWIQGKNPVATIVITC